MLYQKATICTVCVRLYDAKIAKNTQQLSAIRHILAGSSRPAPFLVFGPPGTGKTVTIVEAMKQASAIIRARLGFFLAR